MVIMYNSWYVLKHQGSQKPNLSLVVKLAVSLPFRHLYLCILFLLCDTAHTQTHTSSLAKRGIAGLLPICHPNLIPGFFWGQTSLTEYIIQHLMPTLQLDTSQIHSHSCSQLQCVCANESVCTFNRSAEPGRTSPPSMPLCLLCRVTPSTG